MYISKRVSMSHIYLSDRLSDANHVIHACVIYFKKIYPRVAGLWKMFLSVYLTDANNDISDAVQLKGIKWLFYKFKNST